MSDHRHSPRTHRGAVIASKMPLRTSAERSSRTNGLQVEGVVINTYETDVESTGADDRAKEPRKGIVCDVLTFSTVPGVPTAFLPRTPILTDRGHMHEGETWVPRPCTQRFDTSSSQDMLTLRLANPADLDGEHVLVAFRDNNPNRPIIMGGCTHGRRDTGKEGKPIGERLAVKAADGRPRLTKHHGAFFGVDGAGNFVVDLRNAHNGGIKSDGTEPAPAHDGSSGSYRLYIQQGSALQIVGPNGEVFTIDADGNMTMANGQATLRLEDDGKTTLINASGGMNLDADGAMHLDSPTVQVGLSATERAMLGDRWGSFHDPFMGALLSWISNIQLIVATSDLTPKPGLESLFATAMGRLNAQTIELQARTFGFRSELVLSGTVTIKD